MKKNQLRIKRKIIIGSLFALFAILFIIILPFNKVKAVGTPSVEPIAPYSGQYYRPGTYLNLQALVSLDGNYCYAGNINCPEFTINFYSEKGFLASSSQTINEEGFINEELAYGNIDVVASFPWSVNVNITNLGSGPHTLRAEVSSHNGANGNFTNFSANLGTINVLSFTQINNSCGNSTVQPWEGCDDGNTSWTAGACGGDCRAINYFSEADFVNKINSRYSGAIGGTNRGVSNMNGRGAGNADAICKLTTNNLYSSSVNYTQRMGYNAGGLAYWANNTWKNYDHYGIQDLYLINGVTCQSTCNNNGICESNEDAISCPNDCNAVINYPPPASSNLSPIAVISSPNTANVGASVFFDGRGSLDPDGAVTSYSWDFGDGTFANGSTFNKIFNNAGAHTITLTVADNLGATNSTTKIINIYLCAPNSTQACIIPNGTGSQVCNSIGTAWGVCNLVSCNANYTWNGSACVASAYTLTVNPGNGGISSSGSGTGLVGSTKSISVNVRPGYYFFNWDISGPGSLSSNSSNPSIFTYGTGNTTISARYGCAANYHLSGFDCAPNVGYFNTDVFLLRGGGILTQGISNTSIINATGGKDFTVKGITGQGQILVGDRVNMVSTINSIEGDSVVAGYSWSCGYSSTNINGPYTDCSAAGASVILMIVPNTNAYFDFIKTGFYNVSFTATAAGGFSRTNNIKVTVPKLLELK